MRFRSGLNALSGGSHLKREQRQSKQAIAQAVASVAGRFAPVGRDLILYENRYKHVYEVDNMLVAAGAAGAVCDLGGGLGVNLLVLRELGCTGRLVLVDQLEEYEAGNRMGESQHALRLLHEHDIEVIRRDFWQDWSLPLATASFQAATCFDVVEHLPGHPLRQLGELHRILAPGAACIISGPNGVSLMKRVRAVAGYYPYSPLEAWLGEPYYEHFREYTRSEYEELLRRVGFLDVRSNASAAVTFSRARHRFHRQKLAFASPKVAALWGLAAIELAFPGTRHTIYATGRR